jgi:hypothetical protein
LCVFFLVLYIIFYLEKGELPDCCGSSMHSILGGIWREGILTRKCVSFVCEHELFMNFIEKQPNIPPPPPRINRYSTDPFPNLLLAEDAGVMSLL